MLTRPVDDLLGNGRSDAKTEEKKRHVFFGDADYGDHVQSRNPSINHRGRLTISLFLVLLLLLLFSILRITIRICLRFVWQ